MPVTDSWLSSPWPHSPGSPAPSIAQPRTGSSTHLRRDLLAAGMQTPRHHFTSCLLLVSHILSAESLGISNTTRPRGHNTLEVRPQLRPWEPQGHHPCVRWSSHTALGWAVSPRGLPEPDRPGGKGWRRTSRDPAAPDAEEKRPRRVKSLALDVPRSRSSADGCAVSTERWPALLPSKPDLSAWGRLVSFKPV